MTIEDAIADCKHRPLTDFVQLTKSRAGMYCCPICGSGTGRNKTGALKIDAQTHRVMCFSGGCFGDKGEDTPGALQRIWNCTLPEALTRAEYHLDGQRRAAPPPPKKVKRDPQPEPKREDFTARYKEWHENLLQDTAALDYLHRRGITDEAIAYFNLGYAPEWAHSSHPEIKSRRIIFPRTKSDFSARRMDAGKENKYLLEGSQDVLYNDCVMPAPIEAENDAMPIIVVEGEADTIAVWQTGFKRVIGLDSTKNKDRFIEKAKQINPAAVYILALDNDPDGSTKDGQKTQAYIAEQLGKAGIECISTDTAALYDGKKDAGEAASVDIEAFTRRLYEYVQAGWNIRKERDRAAEIEAYNRSGPGMVDSFLQDIQTPRYQPISSGIPSLDYAIGGGFIRESVVLLGGAPGSGKTALISQICENIASDGDGDILYINLEMGREVLLARSIARIANASGKITVNEILRGYEWDTGTRELVQMAADEYKATIAGHLIYNPGEPETDLDKIMGKIEDERRRIGHPPIVCIDYLQLLTGRPEEDSIAVIKRAMQTLKQYANDNHTIVFIITANNRDSMKTGESGLNSGRDSSNIEYGADLHMGIEYEAAGGKVEVTQDDEGNPVVKVSKGKDQHTINGIKREYLKIAKRNAGIPLERWSENERAIEEKYQEYCTRYIIRVNKNRYSSSEQAATLAFDGAAARFVELDTIHEEPPAYQPKQINIDPEDMPF